MITTMAQSNHIVLVPISAWSHLRTMTQFAINLLALHPSLVITFLITSVTVPRLDMELALQPPHALDQLKGRYRVQVVETPSPEEAGLLAELALFGENSPGTMTGLIKGGDDARFGVPCLFIYDVSLTQIVG
jgi:hypothetical protein